MNTLTPTIFYQPFPLLTKYTNRGMGLHDRGSERLGGGSQNFSWGGAAFLALGGGEQNPWVWGGVGGKTIKKYWPPFAARFF